MRIAIVEDEKKFAKQLIDDLQQYGQETGLTVMYVGLRMERKSLATTARSGI